MRRAIIDGRWKYIRCFTPWIPASSSAVSIVSIKLAGLLGEPLFTGDGFSPIFMLGSIFSKTVTSGRKGPTSGLKLR